MATARAEAYSALVDDEEDDQAPVSSPTPTSTTNSQGCYCFIVCLKLPKLLDLSISFCSGFV